MMKETEDGLIAATLRSMGAVGRRNAVTRTQVARTLGMDTRDGKRVISKILEAERAEGIICSCSMGLFLPMDSDEGDQEVMSYIATVSRKGAGSFRSIKGARKYIARRQREKSWQTQLDLTEVVEEDGEK